MKTAEFIDLLFRKGVTLRAEGPRLLYRAPEGVLTPDLRSELERRKPDIMAILGGTTLSGQDPNSPTLPMREGRSTSPTCLSFSQERIWFLSRLEPTSSSYNVHRAIRIIGPLDVDALERAFQIIVNRHQVFGMICTDRGGRPLVQFKPDNPLRMTILELSHIPHDEREAEVLLLAEAEARKPFDLEAGPLLRVTLLRVEHEHHILFLTTHHLATDGWSLRVVLMKELSVLYNAFRAGTVPSLPALPLQFSDYALRQRDELQGDNLETRLSYWKRQLSGAATVLELPGDRPRPIVQSYRGARVHFSLPASLSQSLRELARQEGVTLFMLLLGAFQTLLCRYTGQADFLVGTATSFRPRVELENLIGPFANVLALRAVLSGDLSFRDFLGQVRQTTIEAFANQELPFEKLLEALQLDRDLSRNPVFQVFFLLHHATRDQNLKLADLTLESLPVDGGTSRFDLSLEMEDGEGELAGSFEYSTDLFERATIERMSQSYRKLLESIVSNPDERISSLRILTEWEYRRLLSDLAGNECDFDSRCVHEIFKEQVGRSPYAIAVVAGETRLTYSALNAAADRVADRLRTLGVSPETVVGLCVDRSPEMLIGMLGILKAGGAYLPLDPTWPRTRLSFMIDETQTQLILTRDSLRVLLPENVARVICIDQEANPSSDVPAYCPEKAISPDNLAYVIYTSGSTGSPKGVAITHRGISALVHWTRRVFEPEDRAGVLASTSMCFDLSVFEIFLPLCTGGMVILARNALNLQELMGREQVTLVNTVPSAAATLLKTKAIPDSVRVLNLAGEPLSKSLAQLAYRKTKVRMVYNLYGPSEDTVYSTCSLVSKGDTADPPIGRPIANTRAYILSTNLEPVPQGVAGELFIGGIGLARGYFNQPALTAERFLPDPFSVGGRLYRTGDLARHRPDGAIEFLGRIDEQIKLRGFRIEPAEVRAALEEHPSVEQALVMVADDLLHSFVTPRDGSPEPDLREFLRTCLPSYMVPSRITRVAVFPLTQNGKVDRVALLALEDLGTDPMRVAVLPRGDLERTIALVWKDVLRLEVVSARESFFDLGGHSLLLVQVHSRLQTILGRTFPLLDLFKYPTISTLARYLDHEQTAASPRAQSRAKLQIEAIRKQARLARERREKSDG